MVKLRVLLTGGGTGGHIYPMIAVAQKLRAWAEKNEIEADLRYFGQPENYKPALESEKIRVVKIISSKLRRYFSLLNFLDFFKFWLGLAQSLCKIYWFMPDVVFSKGGPGALPVILASRFYLIPLVVHESDTIPGFTNKISARFADKMDLAFAAAVDNFPQKTKLEVVGNPVRQELLTQMPQDQAKTSLGFDPQKPLLLVLGGSQGSNRMNDFILTNLDKLLVKYQILHSVGQEKYKDYKLQYDFVTENFSPILKNNYKFVPYLEKEESASFDAADLVLSRGGAGGIFEIAAKGKPSIIVPFPEAASDHQRENAYAYAATGATVVIEQENLLPSIFLNEVEKILNNSENKAKMSAAAKDFFYPESADKIATHILELWRE